MENKDERTLAKEITSALNTFSFDEKAFCEQMTMEHRTLQQNFTRLCISWIRHCADLKEWQVDGRNEAGVKACKIMSSALDDNDISGLPFI